MPQIRLILRPSGPACNHVQITNDVAEVLEVTTIPQLRAAVSSSDSRLITQIKRVARDSGLTDPALLKTFLESREFDFEEGGR